MTTTLENKPLTLSEMRDFIGNISDHARGGNTLKATKTGALVSVDDAYVGHLLGLTVYGNSVQDGTPTPETPVPIKSVKNIGANTTGVNLWGGKHMRDSVLAALTTGAGVSSDTDGDYVWFDATATKRGPFVSNCFKANTQYTLILKLRKSEGAGLTTNMYVYYTNGSNAAISMPSNPNTTQTIVFTTAANKTVSHIAQSNNGYRTILYYNECGLFEGVHTAADLIPSVGKYTPLTLIDDQGVAHTLCRVGNYSDRLHINADGSGTLYATLCEYDMTGDDLTTDVSGTVPSYAGTYTNCYGTASSFLNSIVYRKHGLANNTFHIVANRAGEVFVKANSFVGRMYYDIINEQDGVACTGIINGGKQLVFRMDKTAYPTLDSAKAYFDEHPQHVIFKMAQEVAYHIPAINMPSLPDLVSNAWVSATDADGAAIACECGIEYRRDINKVIGDIEEAIADIVSQ